MISNRPDLMLSGMSSIRLSVAVSFEQQTEWCHYEATAAFLKQALIIDAIKNVLYSFCHLYCCRHCNNLGSASNTETCSTV